MRGDPAQRTFTFVVVDFALVFGFDAEVKKQADFHLN